MQAPWGGLSAFAGLAHYVRGPLGRPPLFKRLFSTLQMISSPNRATPPILSKVLLGLRGAASLFDCDDFDACLL
eukprot:8207616-Pyramimonas_sp.AAC.1